MKTGAKIAIGCAVVAVMTMIAAGVGTFLMARWVKNKADEATGGLERMAETQKEIQRYQEQANENEFSAPADGVIEEGRLLKFLAVRRDMFAVYERHKALIEEQSRGRKPDLSTVGAGIQVFNELRLAQAKAQAREGLSEAEYRYLVQQVYKTAWAASVAKGTGGRSPSRAARELAGQAAEAVRRQLDNPDLTPEQRGQIEEALRRLEEQSDAAERAAEQLDVPEANLELFRQHQDEIQKYAMNGLEWLGL